MPAPASRRTPVFRAPPRPKRFRPATWRAPDCTIAPAASHDRRRELARLLPLWPHELADETPAGRRRLIRELRKALRAERRRGIAGHWTYDLGRHAQLLRAYRVEVGLLRDAGAPGRGRPGRAPRV